MIKNLIYNYKKNKVKKYISKIKKELNDYDFTYTVTELFRDYGYYKPSEMREHIETLFEFYMNQKIYEIKNDILMKYDINYDDFYRNPEIIKANLMITKDAIIDFIKSNAKNHKTKQNNNKPNEKTNDDKLKLNTSDIVELIDNEIKLLKRIPNGNCCTCQDCGQYHDDCNCTEIDTMNKIKKLISDHKPKQIQNNQNGRTKIVNYNIKHNTELPEPNSLEFLNFLLINALANLDQNKRHTLIRSLIRRDNDKYDLIKYSAELLKIEFQNYKDDLT